MDFMALAESRYSCRSYDGRPVEQEKIEKIVKAAMIAPTACNYQPQRVLVLQSPEAIEKLRKCTPCHYNCSTAVIVCYDKDKCFVRQFDNQSSGHIDASIVTTHMMLAAKELGVDSTWLMYFNPTDVAREFDLPEDVVPSAILDLGYPDEKGGPGPQHTDSLPEDAIVKYV